MYYVRIEHFQHGRLKLAPGSMAAAYPAVGRRNLTPTETLGASIGLSAADTEKLVGQTSTGEESDIFPRVGKVSAANRMSRKGQDRGEARSGTTRVACISRRA